MDANQILKSDLLDIIFDGRNKEYGAYELRKTYNKRITIAVIGMLFVVLLVLVGRALATHLQKSDDKAINMITNETTLQ